MFLVCTFGTISTQFENSLEVFSTQPNHHFMSTTSSQFLLCEFRFSNQITCLENRNTNVGMKGTM